MRHRRSFSNQRVRKSGGFVITINLERSIAKKPEPKCCHQVYEAEKHKLSKERNFPRVFASRLSPSGK